MFHFTQHILHCQLHLHFFLAIALSNYRYTTPQATANSSPSHYQDTCYIATCICVEEQSFFTWQLTHYVFNNSFCFNVSIVTQFKSKRSAAVLLEMQVDGYKFLWTSCVQTGYIQVLVINFHVMPNNFMTLLYWWCE
jgi:hypothetical protein